MPLYHLKPDRDCPGCPDCDVELNALYEGQGSLCGGTGKIPPEGEPDVEVCEFTMNGKPIGFFWRYADDDSLSCWCGNPNGPSTVTPFPTEQAALEAARKAAGVTP